MKCEDFVLAAREFTYSHHRIIILDGELLGALTNACKDWSVVKRTHNLSLLTVQLPMVIQRDCYIICTRLLVLCAVHYDLDHCGNSPVHALFPFDQATEMAIHVNISKSKQWH